MVAVVPVVTFVVAVVPVEEFGLVVEVCGCGLPEFKMPFTLLIKGYFPFFIQSIFF